MRRAGNIKDHRVILASASPRRRMLLAQIGLPFDVVESRAPEPAALLADTPEDHVQEAAARKALDVVRRAGHGLVIGADTVVCVDGQVLGKPHSAREARRMLRHLSGKAHTVYTGIAIGRAGKRSATEPPREPSQARELMELTGYEATVVTMRQVSRREISAYVDTGEPLDKAGAYAIQGRGAVLIESIRGCYSNVVGLPLAKLAELLAQLGIRVL